VTKCQRKLAITIAGAVSLGNYESGVVFEVLDALAQHNQWATENNSPGERIEIDVLTGASAGGMTVAMIAQRLLFDGPAMSHPYNNPLYNAWVMGVDIVGLLARGADEPVTHSVLSSDAVSKISEIYLMGRYPKLPQPPPPPPVPLPHPALPSDGRLQLGLALSNLTGVGGTIPLGYDLKERKLMVNPEEAKLVVRLFNLYLESGCVSKLKVRLDHEGVKSKERTSVAGNRSGGNSYSRSALYDILQNRIYLGEIHHRGQNYPGKHQAIVPSELWARVQAQLRSDNQGRRNGLKANAPSLLIGILQDSKGNRFAPTHTSKNSTRYRYYTCQRTIDEGRAESTAVRLPAYDVERQVALRLQSFLQSGKDVMDGLSLPDDHPARTHQLMAGAAKQFDPLSSGESAVVQDFVKKVVCRVVVHPDRIEVYVGKRKLRAALLGEPACRCTELFNVITIKGARDEFATLDVADVSYALFQGSQVLFNSMR
jgi:hypothetical protein